MKHRITMRVVRYLAAVAIVASFFPAAATVAAAHPALAATAPTTVQPDDVSNGGNPWG